MDYYVNSIGVDLSRNSQAWMLRNRQWRLKITNNKRKEPKTLGIPEKGSNMSLRIIFNVERIDGTELNTAQITLYNLNKDTISMLTDNSGVQVELRAGYESTGNLPIVFSGTVIRVVESLAGADRVCEIEAVDGFQELSNSFVSESFIKGTKCFDIIEHIGRVIGVPVLYTKQAKEIAKNKITLYSISVHGAAKDVLNQIFSVLDLSWRFNSGVLEIFVEKEDAINNISTAYVLTPLTGLIGMPERMYESSVTYSGEIASGLKYYMYGYRVNFFMNAALSIHDVIYLESSIAKGLFMIYKMTIKGDSLSGDWQCTAELKEYSPQLEVPQ